MAQHNELGQRGELIALDFLKKQEYDILETNWRWQKAEVDLICQKDNTLIIVEVKTRSSTNYGQPEESITIKKETLLKDAAEAYVTQKEISLEIQFDIISIILNNAVKKIEHIKNVF
jgi:putative endonuclease